MGGSRDHRTAKIIAVCNAIARLVLLPVFLLRELLLVPWRCNTFPRATFTHMSHVKLNSVSRSSESYDARAASQLGWRNAPAQKLSEAAIITNGLLACRPLFGHTHMSAAITCRFPIDEPGSEAESEAAATAAACATRPLPGRILTALADWLKTPSGIVPLR